MNSSVILEVCSNSLSSSLEAQRGGAYRVELCSSIPEGGCTPSYGEIVVNREQLSTTKLNVIIRPRGGDFLYSKEELDVMERDIALCRELGVDGVVFGILTAEGNVDKGACARLIKAAGSMQKSFHRAFDMSVDCFVAMNDIIELGFDTILTSGCATTAIEGAKLLAKLVEQAGERITIMVGCGVTEDNIELLQQITKAKAYHASARSTKQSDMIYRNPNVSMGGSVKIEEYSFNFTSRQRVENIIQKLK